MTAAEDRSPLVLPLQPGLSRENEGGVHEGQVREGLREVPGELPAVRIVLFGQQPHVIAQHEEALEQAAGLIVLAGQGQGVGKPE